MRDSTTKRRRSAAGGELRLPARLGLAMLVIVMIPIAGCDVQELLNVTDPDIIAPESLEGAEGRAALFAGAIANFNRAYDGSDFPGSTLAGYTTYTGLLADEWLASGTFPTREQWDRRAIQIRNGSLELIYTVLQLARNDLESTAAILREAGGENPDRIPHLITLAGYTYIMFGEGYCSGVPFSTRPLPGQNLTDENLGESRTHEEILQIALDRFNTALADASIADSVAMLARVGKAHVLVDMEQYQQAAEVAAQVPTDFLYILTNSTNTGRQENGVFSANIATERWSISNGEGVDPPEPFLGTAQDGTDAEGLFYLAERDPRVPWIRDIEEGTVDEPDIGFDSETPQYNLQGWPQWGIQLTEGGPTPLAFGIEARLIEAEAALQAGDFNGMLQILQALRDNVTLDQSLIPDGFEYEPLPAVDSRDEAINILFEERAYWMYSLGRRLGDLRRLVADYGRPAGEVYPEGPYFEGGNYGDDLMFPVPFVEQNNPKFDRSLCTPSTIG